MLTSSKLSLPMSYWYDIYVPEEHEGVLLICLHGYSQSKEDSMHFGRSITDRYLIAALQAPHPHHRREKNGHLSTGFGWVSGFKPEEDISNHHEFLTRLIELQYAKGAIEEQRAVIFGFSQSVSLNYRFAAAQPDYVKGVVAVAGAAPSEWSLDEEPNLPMPVLHIMPQDDRAYPLAKAQQFKRQLRAHCKQLSWHDVPGGHRVPNEAYPLIRRWLKGL